MISIDPENQSEHDTYKLLIGSIIPRPIAFVTTRSLDGVVNAAPFSYFNIIAANPPLLSVSVQRKNGEPKDTARNALDIGAFVVHISDESYIEAINVTAASLPPDESEIDLTGLQLIESDKVQVPGVAEAKIRMECVLERSIPLGGVVTAPACDLLIGRVVRFHVARELYRDGKIDPELLRPVSRLAGNSYSRLGEIFSLERPE
ncbi:flavin reductase family protein [Paenibacillus lutrae]|uniref:Flavin reductase family protein n=1 Tax=Paenibacillus lutrae TaxID=2078573 RepID=A0A7X3FG17_9BACL|nr:flavin reductase family protein [Paenibacillus lutrae]MVO98803.1 flavin reductase family protein [Paenibacillus lutrae]